MKLYRVDQGPATVGSGDIIGLTSEQAATRRHNLEPLEGHEPGEGRIPFRALALLYFKVGEYIALELPPSRSQAQFLVDVDAEQGDPQMAGATTAPPGSRPPRTGAPSAPTPGQQLPGAGDLTRDPRFGDKKRPRAKAELHQQILAACGVLNAEDPDTFTADGKPQVKAVEAVLGYEITADERDEAWAKRQD